MPPGLSVDNCPPEIRENPLPHDRCSEPVSDYRLPEDRFTRLSIFLDLDFPIPWDQFRMGVGGIYRPIQSFGLGAQAEWNFSDQVNVLGRLQLSINTHRYGMHRLTFAALAGLEHLYGQEQTPLDGGPSERVSGNLFQMGLEATWDVRILRSLSISPFVSLRYTPASTLTSTDDPSRSIELDDSFQGILGLRISGDFWNVGAL